MHGDAREAQHLAVMRLADERPGEIPPYQMGGGEQGVGQAFGQPPSHGNSPPMAPTSMPGTSGGSSLVPGIHDDFLLAQLLARRASGSTDAASDAPGDPMQPPMPKTSPHAVLLPYAQLPHSDASKQIGSASLAAGWALNPAQPPHFDHHTHLPLQPPPHMQSMNAPMSLHHFAAHPSHLMGGLPPGHPSASPSSGVSLFQSSSSPPGGASLLPSPGSSVISSNLPSTHPSTHPSGLPSPAMAPGLFGSNVTSPPPQQLLPPPLLPGAQLAGPPQAFSVSPVLSAAAAPAACACMFDSFGSTSAGLHLGDVQGRPPFGACAQTAPVAMTSTSAACGFCAPGSDTTTSASSGCGSRFGDILRDEMGAPSTAASTNYTRTAIAKQLSVLFDGSSADNLHLMGKADAEADHATAFSSSDDGRVSSPLESLVYTSDATSSIDVAPDAPANPLSGRPLEGSLRINVEVSDHLVDQLAAVCCSPPRHETSMLPWRASPTSAWQ